MEPPELKPKPILVSGANHLALQALKVALIKKGLPAPSLQKLADEAVAEYVTSRTAKLESSTT